MLPDLTLSQWIAVQLIALCVAVAKCGMPGLGILAVPLMAQVFPPRTSVGMLLPVLIVGDCFAVLLHRRHADGSLLLRLAPPVFIGVLLGWWFLRVIDNADWFGPLIGALILAMVVLLLWQRWRKIEVPHQPLVAAGVGASAGWVSTIANAAGPIMALYFQARAFDKRRFVGTAAWFFLVLNTVKVPFLIEADVMPLTALGMALTTVPAVLIGAVSGRWLLEHIPDRWFDIAVLVLIVAAAVRLMMP